MRRIWILSLTLLGLLGCATLSDGGAKVQIIKVTTNSLDVEQAEANLKKENCTFVSDIEAPIAAGSSDEYYRLEIGIKNKAAEVGGNVVISSMQPYFSIPEHTKGKVYQCPRSLKSDSV
jgi:hypothetical protein